VFHPQRNWKTTSDGIITSSSLMCFILKGIESYVLPNNKVRLSLFHPQRNWKSKFSKASLNGFLYSCFILKGIERQSPSSYEDNNALCEYFRFHPQRNWKTISFVSSSHGGSKKFHPQRNWKYQAYHGSSKYNELSFILKGIES